eukprot:4873935-Amphidinium_carterae.1
MRDIGVENFYIELIETFPCASKEELRAREGHWIREIGTLNHLISGRSWQEYKNDNRSEINTKAKQYYQTRKDYLGQKVECDVCGRMITKG